jgi:ParB-like chromosome segregation protein Spo0J
MDKIEKIAITDLIPYARNSRTHSDAQVAQIAASIKEFGFTNPVLIDGDGGIIAGHGRVMAARKLKMSEVPCIRLSHLSDTQKRAYIIADNKLALNAGWDEELLGLELTDIDNDDFDIDLTGFDYGFLDASDSSGLNQNQSVELDYGLLNEHDDLTAQASQLTQGVKKAIQIEFEAKDYVRALGLVKSCRDNNVYIGACLIKSLEGVCTP